MNKFSKAILLVTHLALQLTSIKLITALDDQDLLDEDESVETENSDEKVESVKDKQYYAKDPDKVKRLVIFEEKLVSAINKVLDDFPYFISSSVCEYYLNQYMNGYHKDSNAVAAKDDWLRNNECQEIDIKSCVVAANPLLSYKLIRRIVVILLMEIYTECKEDYPGILDAIRITFANQNLVPPTREDLQDAALGILKLHFIYGFNATDQLRLGIFNGVDTKTVLSFRDCLTIADLALDLRMEVLAYQWLMAGVLASLEQEDKPLEEEYDSMQHAWSELKYLLRTRRIQTVHEMLMGKTPDVFYRFNVTYEHEGPCRGELSEMAEEDQSELYCFTVRNDPYYVINPLKTEVLSIEPEILQFHEFLTSKEIEYVKRSSSKTTKRSSSITTPLREQEGGFRVWNQTFPKVLAEANQDPIVKLVNYKIESLSGLKVFQRYASIFQLASYGPLGVYENVEKIRNTFGAYNQLADETKGGIFLMFLSEAIMGGYEGFFELGVFAKPYKGSALYWRSRGEDGKPDKRVYQRSCPVILGYKEMANQVIG